MSPDSGPDRDQDASILLAPGPRAAERALLERLRAARAASAADLTLLRHPLRVLVPSRSLRLHVTERIAAELGPTAGIAVQTLHAVAIEILDRSGVRAGGGDALVEVLVRRAARREVSLREACEGFRDGYRSVVASVRDLLDAGMEPGLVEPLAECLGAARAPTPELARAHALVRVAGAVARELVARDHAGRPFLLARAREALLKDTERALPTRALFVHGFADLTGRAADLVEALVDRLGGQVLIDLPPDPARPDRPDLGAAYTQRLTERLTGVAGQPRKLAGGDAAGSFGGAAPADPEQPAAPGPACFRAPGASAEVREVARRLRSALAAGARPERCAVVARDLGIYRTALRAQLRRLAVPYSGLRLDAPVDGPGRRVAALVELLEEGASVRTDRWFDALPRYRGSEADAWRPPSELVRLAFRLRGGVRLELVPEVEFPGSGGGASARREPASTGGPGSGFKLPLRKGLVRRGGADRGEQDPGERADGQGALVAPRATVDRADLAALTALARSALARLERWSERASLARHLEEFEGLRREDLGWRTDDVAEERVAAALAELADGLTDEILEREEFVRAVAGALERIGGLPLGGEGGGVQVLEVMEARGRTFDHLFVLGLQRDTFPRTMREDPLLGDGLRWALAELLPEIPIKSRSRDEERYLFAQLVAASPNTTLSWQVSDDDGRARVASPLLVRVLGEAGESEVELVPALTDPEAPGPRTAHEAAVRGGLLLRTKGYRERLAAALSEARTDPALIDELASVRTRVLEAYGRAHRDPVALAPWLGFLGDQAGGHRPDPLEEAFFVTRFEALATCPWRTVLERNLRLGRQPDPVEELPTVESRVVGDVVHGVLERIARDAGVPEGGSLEEALGRDGWRTPWPGAERFEHILLDTARAKLEEERLPAAGHVRLVAACARALLERARSFLEGESRRFEDGRVLGVEVSGRASVPLAAGAVPIAFKADRVERREGTVVLSDYKTGRPKEAKDFPAEIEAGLALQPIAYALAAEAVASGTARGRYLYFQAEPDAIELAATPGAHDDAFASAVGTVVQAWRAGALFPRMVDSRDKEPTPCAWCEVSEACLRGDSGARQALRELAAAPERAPELHELFQLTPKDVKDRAKRRASKRGRS